MSNATLVIDMVDTRTGPTLIDAGSILELDNGDTAGSLGSGLLTNNGALLFNASGDEAYGYPVYGAGSITNIGSGGTITLGNNIQANYLVQAGSGILLLQGNNSLTGGGWWCPAAQFWHATSALWGMRRYSSAVANSN